MFIRALHFEVKPGHFDQAVGVFRESVFPDLEKEPGFMRVILTGDAAANKGILYSMWQSEEYAQRYVDSGEAARLLAPFAELFEHPPEILGYPSIFDREF